MARLRYNGLSNSLGASLTSGGTTITFASKLTYAGGDVPTISGSDYIPLSILDADGNCAEVVHLTAYTSGATTGTIARGKEDTTGVEHDNGASLVQGATVADVRDAPGQILGYAHYAPVVGVAVTATTTSVDCDATNLAVTFTVPDSGAVLVTIMGSYYGNSATGASAVVREGSSDVGNETRAHEGSSTQKDMSTVLIPITGLTPGDSKTYKMGLKRAFGSGDATCYFRSDIPACILVQAL